MTDYQDELDDHIAESMKDPEYAAAIVTMDGDPSDDHWLLLENMPIQCRDVLIADALRFLIQRGYTITAPGGGAITE